MSALERKRLVSAIRQSVKAELKLAIMNQMKVLAARGVTPSWENFTELNSTASKLRSQINSSEFNQLKRLWRVLFDEIRPASEK